MCCRRASCRVCWHQWRHSQCQSPLPPLEPPACASPQATPTAPPEATAASGIAPVLLPACLFELTSMTDRPGCVFELTSTTDKPGCMSELTSMTESPGCVFELTSMTESPGCVFELTSMTDRPGCMFDLTSMTYKQPGRVSCAQTHGMLCLLAFVRLRLLRVPMLFLCCASPSAACTDQSCLTVSLAAFVSPLTSSKLSILLLSCSRCFE